ncbi:hypothetical protein [Bacillus xiapuensis]|uniref:Uncharacterized protein n=1 Tax=Bacillus xiapuensis TaxID=2014075 RepID=A0ABU6N8N7_9BACI|nr:hypothetical protein [Bacillus xiapuensis]
MRNIEITLREILISIVIVLVMVGLGFFLAESIHDTVTSDNEKYFKALKVDNNPDLFDYAIRTDVGDMLSYGQFKANEPVSDRLIKGKYYSINKTEEHYTMHTRTVTYKCGKHTCTRTEVYWTWDYVGEEDFNTKTFTYLGREFNYNKIHFYNYEYYDTVQTSSHVRFKIYIIPREFNGTLYSKASNKTIKDNSLYANQKIKEVIDGKEHSADHWVIGFWIAWSILIAAIVFIFIALDNKYINNKR